MAKKNSKNFITAIARGIDVIRSFDAEASSMTAADVAARTGLSRATARRVLLTLTELGYVHTDGKWFGLSAKVLDLGFAFLSSMHVADTIEPILERASKAARETCALTVLEGHDALVVAASIADRVDRLTPEPGERFPAHLSSTGRLLLAQLNDDELKEYFDTVQLDRPTTKSIASKNALRAELEAIRGKGYAIVDQEFDVGLFSIGMLVPTDGANAFAGVSFIGNVARINRSNAVKTFLPILQKAGKELRKLLPQRQLVRNMRL